MPIGIASIRNAAARPYRVDCTDLISMIQWTSDLDEGPIVEQDTVRVGHGLDSEAFVRRGKDVENVVLARAVYWHAERRVLLNGHRTVVFRQGA